MPNDITINLTERQKLTSHDGFSHKKSVPNCYDVHECHSSEMQNLQKGAAATGQVINNVASCSNTTDDLNAILSITNSETGSKNNTSIITEQHSSVVLRYGNHHQDINASGKLSINVKQNTLDQVKADIFNAIMHDDKQQLRKLIKESPIFRKWYINVSLEPYSHFSPLMLAVKTEKVDCVLVLCQSGANPIKPLESLTFKASEPMKNILFSFACTIASQRYGKVGHDEIERKFAPRLFEVDSVF